MFYVIYNTTRSQDVIHFFIISTTRLEILICNRNMQEFALYTYEEFEFIPPRIIPLALYMLFTSWGDITSKDKLFCL